MNKTELFTREHPLPGFWRYSVIRKATMAISGIVLVVFLFAHWNGNRVLLEGETAFNAYLDWLQSHVLLHYGVWIIIFSALLSHLAVGPKHWKYNHRARPVAYFKKINQETTWAARSMIVSGAAMSLFLVMHIAQVRGWLVLHEQGDSGGVYQNMQAGFENWAVVSIYLLGQIALAFHLYHGVWSLFQTLGINHTRYNHWRRPIATVIGVGLAALNIGLILLNLDFVQHLLGRIV